ncbi:hypothetical protein [Aldersonia kunmingensis]|uniref:hypothetical protein n=1 Tax=Aldersonia kunmingensis TaxID=408066 RepID=UPI000831E8E4|nr:hypothetical protein [Aldersonia kunmingensis]
MASGALFVGWGEPVHGREKAALEIFNTSMEYWGRLQADGKIESFDVALLEPHGSDLGGFVLIRGTREQIDTLQHDEEWRRLIAAVRLRVEGVGAVDAIVDERLLAEIGYYQDAVSEIS